MSRDGGAFGFGTIFKTDSQGENPVLVYSFTDTLNGIHPEGSLVQANNRKLYGMTKFGGLLNMGTIFEFDIFTNSLTKLMDFDSAYSGSYPSGNLIEPTNSILYGKNGYGGLNNLGVLFKFDISTNTFSKLIDFDISNTGGNSENGSIVPTYNVRSGSSSGLGLVICNPVGGIPYQGVISVYNVNDAMIIKRTVFPTMPGLSTIRGDMIETSPGKFLGMNATGGNVLGGYLYEYDGKLNTITIKLSFDTLSGYRPYGKLTKGLNGKYYGLTSSGGSSGTGTLFEYDIYSNSISNIVDFGSLSTNISQPFGSLVMGTNGKLYAMGTQGGVCGAMLFEYDYDLNLLTEKTDLCSTIGVMQPYYNALIEINQDTIPKVWPGDCSVDMKVNNTDFLYIGVAYNDIGAIRNTATTNFVGQFCNPWSGTYYGNFPSNPVNANNADCNGDGIVDTLDVAAIRQNYGRSRPLRLTNLPSTTLSHEGLCPVADRNSVALGDLVNFEINVATASDPMDFAYGVAFSIQFDPHLVDTSRISFDYTNSALGTLGVDMIAFEKPFYSSGVIDVALVRTDHVSRPNVGGRIATLQIHVSSSVTSITYLKVSTLDIYPILASGSYFSLNQCYDSVAIDPNLLDIKTVELHEQPAFFPNPVYDRLTIRMKNEVIQTIDLLNLSGKNVRSMAVLMKEHTFKVEDLATGIYVARIVTKENVYNRLIQIMR
jgi:uncharacterized repeat protein (TIGR03803 family)